MRVCHWLQAVLRISLDRMDHPLAKRVVSIIRDQPKDELVALQKKREAMFAPMRHGVKQLAEQQKQREQREKDLPRQTTAGGTEVQKNVSCCWVEYRAAPSGGSTSSVTKELSAQP